MLKYACLPLSLSSLQWPSNSYGVSFTLVFVRTLAVNWTTWHHPYGQSSNLRQGRHPIDQTNWYLPANSWRLAVLYEFTASRKSPTCIWCRIAGTLSKSSYTAFPLPSCLETPWCGGWPEPDVTHPFTTLNAAKIICGQTNILWSNNMK